MCRVRSRALNSKTTWATTLRISSRSTIVNAGKVNASNPAKWSRLWASSTLSTKDSWRWSKRLNRQSWRRNWRRTCPWLASRWSRTWTATTGCGRWWWRVTSRRSTAPSSWARSSNSTTPTQPTGTTASTSVTTESAVSTSVTSCSRSLDLIESTTSIYQFNLIKSITISNKHNPTMNLSCPNTH